MLLLGTISALAVRFMAPQVGAWIVECDLDLGSAEPLPAGRQVLTVGTAKLLGTVDPKGTGRFGEKAKARIVAGGNGWGSPVKKQNFHNDAGVGVRTTEVFSATASAVGETVVDNAPDAFGPDFDRVDTLTAAQVFDGRPWHVDAAGVTQVGAAWPALELGADVSVLEYDPKAQRAEFASDELLWPGTVIKDIRFGTVTVRSVDQSFTVAGSRGSAYMGPDLDEVLVAAVRGIGTDPFVKAYTYRVASQTGDRVKLQAVVKASGIPDSLLVPVWPGVPGSKATHKTGSLVAVVFLDGDKTKPRVVHFDGSSPLELHFDAEALIELGAGATSPAAKGDIVAALILLLKAFSSGLTPVNLAAFATTLNGALNGLPSPSSTKVMVGDV